MLTSGCPRSASCDAPATKPAHLLRFTLTHRPYPVFCENRRPSTCGFIFARDAMVGGCRPNVVDGPVSWRAVRGGGRKGPGRGAAAWPPPAGHAPRAGSGIACPSFSSAPGIRARAAESFSEIVLASPSEFPYSTSSHGGVAQLGERLTGSQEVRGSIPLVSTRVESDEPLFIWGSSFFVGIKSSSQLSKLK